MALTNRERQARYRERRREQALVRICEFVPADRAEDLRALAARMRSGETTPKPKPAPRPSAPARQADRLADSVKRTLDPPVASETMTMVTDHQATTDPRERWLETAETLLQLRADHPGTHAFSQALSAHNLAFGKNDRAALLWIGQQDPELIRAALRTSKRTSVRTFVADIRDRPEFNQA